MIGKVTHNGKPVPAGTTIVFVNQDNAMAAVGQVAADGTYTLLMRYTTDDGVRHTEHNETRVFHRRPEGWQLVHCHKSPMWPAPHAPR